MVDVARVMDDEGYYCPPWEDPADAGQARRHLLAHHEGLGARRPQARPADGP